MAGLTITLAEAQAQLATVQAAINQLLIGKTVTELKVGSGPFQRVYKYQECSMDNLLQLKDELLSIIAALSPATLATFGTNRSFQHIIRKGSF